MVHGNDMPQGLAFGMGMNQQAMENFAKMSEEEKRQVLEAARSTRSKEQMQCIIEDLIRLK